MKADLTLLETGSIAEWPTLGEGPAQKTVPSPFQVLDFAAKGCIHVSAVSRGWEGPKFKGYDYVPCSEVATKGWLCSNHDRYLLQPRPPHHPRLTPIEYQDLLDAQTVEHILKFEPKAINDGVRTKSKGFKSVFLVEWQPS